MANLVFERYYVLVKDYCLNVFCFIIPVTVTA